MTKKTSVARNERLEKIKRYFEETKYHSPSNTLWGTISRVNKYKRRALDLGCGSMRDSKFLSNCGFIVDAIDISPLVKKYANFFKYRPKGSFNLKIANYNNIDLGKNKYLLINAQNSLSFNSKGDIKKLIHKIYIALQSSGYFCGNFFGPKDFWSKFKGKKVSIYTIKQVKNLLKRFIIESISEEEFELKAVNGEMRHSHVISFIAKKPTTNLY